MGWTSEGRQQLLRLVLEDVRVQGWQVELRLRIPIDEHPPDDTTMPASPLSGKSKGGRSPRSSGRAKRGCQAMTVCVPLVNICEHCPNFRTDPSYLPVLAAQRLDTQTLARDAEARGWISEAERHHRLIARLDAVIGNAQAQAG